MSFRGVSVIVVNWNGEAVIGECLESLTKQSLLPSEIIVVDNGSTDTSLEVIHSFDNKLPLIVVPTGENLGFAKANNLGSELSKEGLVALLNNDAVAEPQWLKEMVTTMGRYPECGIVASKLLVYGKDCIDSTGDGFSTALKGFKMGEGEPASSRCKEEEVMAACAGAVLYRRECIEEVGFFDQDFFLVWEDVDLSLRARWGGWRIFYSPKAVVHHKVRSSIVANSPVSVYYTVRNTTLVRMKNIPFSVFARCLLSYLSGELAMFLYFCVKLGMWSPYLRGKLDAFAMLPRHLRKRRDIMENRKVSTRDFYALFTSILGKEFFFAKLQKFRAGNSGRFEDGY